MTARSSEINRDVRDVMAEYDATVRANMGGAMGDTLAAVAACDDGMYGAWGEVLDTVDSLGIMVHHTLPTDPFLDALHDAWVEYQQDLRGEVGPVRLAAQRSQR